jgi:hypothetical protein
MIIHMIFCAKKSMPPAILLTTCRKLVVEQISRVLYIIQF